MCTLAIDNLGSWSAPDGLGKSLYSADVKYDQVSGGEYAEAVLEHLRRSNRTDLLDIYSMALENKESSSIIRAKRASDGAIMGTLLMLRADSKLTGFAPGFQNHNRGCIAAPVITPGASDKDSMLQGLVLLGVRQLKKQGVATVVFDKVSQDGQSHVWGMARLTDKQVREDSAIKYLYALGFEVAQTFDEIGGDPVHWTMTAPG